MFLISKKPIVESQYKEQLRAQSAGAFVSFEGWVRRYNNDQEITSLEYDIYEELALKEGEMILKEAKESFSIVNTVCIHRSGALSIGDMAVWIGVTAGHRKDALRACEYIIDSLKVRLPVWKKEHYKNGDSGWINCQSAHFENPNELSLKELQYYSRQMNLPSVGMDGQKKLKHSKVLVVGAGGLGSPALLYLASSGVGTIGICDFDKIDLTNLHRQPLYSSDQVGQFKSLLAGSRLRALNPHIHVVIHNERLSEKNVKDIILTYDIILDCSDNFQTKFLLNDACVLLKKDLVMASVYQFEGQVKVYRSHDPLASCLRCLWPEIPDGACQDCATVGILGFVPGFFGMIQAAETVKILLGLPGLGSGEMLIFDFLSYRMKTIKQSRDIDCPVCGENATITTLNESSNMEDNKIPFDIRTLSAEQFQKYELVDIREPMEQLIKPIVGFQCPQIPLSQISEHVSHFSPDKKYLLFCERGIRSGRLADELRKSGIPQVFSVIGGADAVNAYIAEHKASLGKR